MGSRRNGLHRVGLTLLMVTAVSACAANGIGARAAESASAANESRTSTAADSPAATPAQASAPSSPPRHSSRAIANQAVAEHQFLAGMYADDYFPKPLVDKGKAILLRLCERIERERPANTAALYALTHAATKEFNRLDEEFAANGSEIETAAREVIAEDFAWIAKTYGFDADIEELIAPRDW